MIAAPSVTKSFSGTVVLRDMTLDVAAGAWVGLVGGNGQIPALYGLHTGGS